MIKHIVDLLQALGLILFLLLLPFIFVSLIIGAVVFVYGQHVFWLITTKEGRACFRLCLFSGVEGVVLDCGTPVAGALLERTWHLGYNETSGVDYALTDNRGYFRFPKVTRYYILTGLLPFMQSVVGQSIYIDPRGRKLEAWMATKWDYAENSELGKPIRLVCHLDKVPVFTDIPNNENRSVFGVSEFVDQLNL